MGSWWTRTSFIDNYIKKNMVMFHSIPFGIPCYSGPKKSWLSRMLRSPHWTSPAQPPHWTCCCCCCCCASKGKLRSCFFRCFMAAYENKTSFIMLFYFSQLLQLALKSCFPSHDAPIEFSTSHGVTRMMDPWIPWCKDGCVDLDSCLVVQFHHLEKYEFANGKDDIPYMENKKQCLKPPPS